ncbi:hypothetical protein [Lonsdalea iberica]|uniref:hypothetical protein n=1 Tax=Lonsdalea iberica TaxID=1082703 RepID=UPI0014289545|nr:hypothetical protein [Lonsdalea iberica]
MTRLFNNTVHSRTGDVEDLHPAVLRPDIARRNSLIDDTIGNGIDKPGFCRT